MSETTQTPPESPNLDAKVAPVMSEAEEQSEADIFWTMTAGSADVERPKCEAFSKSSTSSRIALLQILGSSLLSKELLDDARERKLLND